MVTVSTGSLAETMSYLGATETVLRVDPSTGSDRDGLTGPAGGRLATRTGSTLRHLLVDPHGNLTAAEGAGATTIVEAIRTDAYGVELDTYPTTPSGLADVGYGGRFDLAPAGAEPLYDFTARDYVPGLGAFASLDTYQGSITEPRSLHRFAYAWGNPATMIDPTGHASADPSQGCPWGPEDCDAVGWTVDDYRAPSGGTAPEEADGPVPLTFVGPALVGPDGLPLSEDGANLLETYCRTAYGVPDIERACAGAAAWDAQLDALRAEYCRAHRADCDAATEQLALTALLLLEVGALVYTAGADAPVLGPSLAITIGRLQSRGPAVTRWLSGATQRFLSRLGSACGCWGDDFATLGTHGRGAMNEDLLNRLVNNTTRRLPFNFKHIDGWEGDIGRITSQKIYNTAAPSFSTSRFGATVRRDLAQLLGYSGGRSPSTGIVIRAADIVSRRLQVTINPAGLTRELEWEMYRLYQQAASSGVQLEFWAMR